MKPNRNPLARFCDLDDPDEVRQVETLREMLAFADEMVANAEQKAQRDIANAEQNAQRDITNAERLAGRMRDRVQIQSREINRRQSRASVHDGLQSVYRYGAGGE
jgi:vacuolar-type H+-ATPase subunit H